VPGRQSHEKAVRVTPGRLFAGAITSRLAFSIIQPALRSGLPAVPAAAKIERMIQLALRPTVIGGVMRPGGIPGSIGNGSTHL